MYEFLGALAFAILIAGYVLAVMFIRHPDDDRFSGRGPIHHQGRK